MKHILIIFLTTFIYKHVVAETISKNEMFMFKPDHKVSALRTLRSETFFEKSKNFKQCKLTNYLVSRDKNKKEDVHSLMIININSNQAEMGIPKFTLDSRIKIIKDGESSKNKKWEKTIFFIGQQDQENFLLFAPFWRIENSKTNELKLGKQHIEIVGDIKEFIHSLRELISVSLEQSIINPKVTRPKEYSKGLLFPYLLINDTKLKSYSTRLAFSPNIFSQFAECVEPILLKTMKNPILNLTSNLTSKPNLYLTCSGKDPIMNMKLPIINVKLNFHKGISTVTQGTEYIEYAVNNHDALKSEMQFGKQREISSIWSYRWNNTPKNLLASQDNMFGGYDVYSRFMVSNFYKNENNVWVHMQLYRSLDYKPEIWKRKCIKKDKNWWKRVTYGIKGLDEK